MGKNNRRRRSHKKSRRAKKRRELKKNNTKSSKSSFVSGPVLRKIPNPFDHLSESEREQVLKEIAEGNEKSYSASLSKISELFHLYEPTLLLSALASYGLTTSVGKDGVQARDSDAKIHQSHVEICQALALQTNINALSTQPPPPDIIQELWDAITTLTTSHSYRDIANFEDDSVEEKAVSLLQQWIKQNTMIVRNWGYFFQVKNISQELYGHFDTLIENEKGYTISNIINLFQLLIKQIEKANTNRHKTLSDLYQLRNKIELINKYHELINLPEEEAKQFIERIDLNKLPFKHLFLMLVSHHDLWLNENYEFYPDKLAEELNIDLLSVTKILEEFSLKWGDLESFETEHLYLSNPVWLHPIINCENNKYFCVFPQAFFSFIIPSLDRIIGSINKTALSTRRALYLEEKIVEIINRRFPESNTVSGLKWSIDNTEYETDLITFIDSHAIIVEAKSGKISAPALRGAPARLKKHIEELLIAPNTQSKRLKERLEQLIKDPDIDDGLRNKLPVNLSQIHKIIRVSVSLEDFGSIQANIHQLNETGWLPTNFEPCPTMTLADFETLFDFLDHPVQILHYLSERQHIEKTIGYMGCELDLMGLYVGTLFNLGDLKERLIITEMSSPLDIYYNSKSEGIEIPKPAPKISPFFTEIMEQLEKRNTPRWTELGVILNKISPDDQRQFIKTMQIVKINVKNNWMTDGHKNMIISIPSGISEYAICYILYCNKNADRREEFINGATNSALEHEQVKKCLIIAKNLDKDDSIYHFIGLLERND